MKALSQHSGKAAPRCGILFAIAVCTAYGQTLINLGTQGRNVDFSNAPWTRPVKTGPALPGTCSQGDLFFNTSAPSGQNLYACTGTNTWSVLGAAPGLADPGSNGLVVRTGLNTTTSVPGPAGAVVGTTDTQTLTHKSLDASEVNTGVFSAAQMPAFTGDISTLAGSTAATLPSVNGTPGTFGDAAHALQLTVDGKGRVTAISSVASSGAPITAAQLPALTGDVTSAAGSAATTLATVNNTPGTYGDGTHSLQLAIDAKGRVTAVTPVPLTAESVSPAQLPALTGDVTSTAGTAATTLANVNSTPGAFGDGTHSLQVVVDSKGRVTSIGQVAITQQPVSASQLPALTGDVTSTAGTAATTLATVNSNPGTYGDGNHSVQVSVDAKGRVTAISPVPLQPQQVTAAQLPALMGDVTTPGGSATTTLATVNNTPGTYGDATHSVQLTVDAKGRITSISSVAAAGGSSSSITPGTLASMPATCTVGSLYFATDQPANQQIYTCSSANTYTQLDSLGPSGALAFTNGSLDIVTSVVPRLPATNTFSGLNIFGNGIQLSSANPQPGCSSSTRGMFWFLNNGSSKDGVQVCVYNGSAFAWVSLY